MYIFIPPLMKRAYLIRVYMQTEISILQHDVTLNYEYITPHIMHSRAQSFFVLRRSLQIIYIIVLDNHAVL